jgi:predicted metalloprotease with PDZ domain
MHKSLSILLGSFPLWGMSQIIYRLFWADEPPYTYRVVMRLSPSKATYTDLRMPAWRPGRYILQNYAGALYHFSAQNPNGQPLPYKKTDKDTWRIFHPPKTPFIEVSYRMDARTLDAGSSYQGRQLIYFNPITLFLYPVGRLQEPCQLELPDLPPDWAVATALPAKNKHHYQAPSYHHLVDAPFVIAPTLRQTQTSCAGITLHVHFWGEVGAKNLNSFLNSLCQIVQTQKNIWGELPLSEYHFIYILVPFQMRHAVEHENCALFVLPQSGAQDENSLQSFLPISAHEFFHVWNVKRLRPAAIWPYDYNNPPMTSLHWLTEGVTDYYTALSLVRAGLLSESDYWNQLSTFLQQIENSWVYQTFSPAEQSMDSWHATSPYRPPFLQASFYASGKRLAFLLDMFIRRESEGHYKLDDLLRYLYQTYYKQGRGLPEDGVQKALFHLLGPTKKEKIAEFWRSYVEGCARISYRQFLEGLPIQVEEEEKPAQGWARIGIRQWSPEGDGLRIGEVEPLSCAAMVGLMRGDVLYTVDTKSAKDIDPAFWDQLPVGAQVLLGWRHEDEIAEGLLRLEAHRIPLQKRLRLTPLKEGFGTRD